MCKRILIIYLFLDLFKMVYSVKVILPSFESYGIIFYGTLSPSNGKYIHDRIGDRTTKTLVSLSRHIVSLYINCVIQRYISEYEINTRRTFFTYTDKPVEKMNISYDIRIVLHYTCYKSIKLTYIEINKYTEFCFPQ